MIDFHSFNQKLHQHEYIYIINFLYKQNFGQTYEMKSNFHN